MQQTPGVEKRRLVMVDRHWQTSVATRLIVSAMVVIALTQIVMIFFLASGVEETTQEPSSEQWYLTVLLTSALQLVLLVGTMWWAAIRITHSVSGPALVIERALDAMREGRFDSRLKLRDRDALKSLAEAAQRLSDHLQQQQGTARAKPGRPEPDARHPVTT
ncbi:MAG TPA: hypothetical protein VFT55_15795 [Planctomycetota bacterium]|nr:hypothetical protein [Planctomycetota bacterium]